MKNSTQTWIIILAAIAIALGIALFWTQSQQASQKSDPAEYEFIQAAKGVISQDPGIAPAPIVETPAPAITAGKYAIQIVSLSDPEKAENVLKGIQGTGLTGYVARVDLKERGVWHRVYVGPYQTMGEATAALPGVKAIHKDAFILSTQ